MKTIIGVLSFVLLTSAKYDYKPLLEARFYLKGKEVKLIRKDQFYSLPKGLAIYVNGERVKCDSISYVPISAE